MLKVFVVLCLLVTLTSREATAETYIQDPLGIYPTIWGEIGNEYGIDPYLLYSVALIESRRKWDDGLVRPWPWTITKNGKAPKSYYPKTKVEAEQLLKELMQETINLDVGIMQVNLGYHRHLVTVPTDLLNPDHNIRIGAFILRKAMTSKPEDLEMAVGRYHSWRPSRGSRYGKKVLFLAKILKGYEEGL